ncbi:MAG: response regulator [Cyclonatronaceae bacterium]
MINVLLADDHNIVRYGISSILNTSPDINIVAEASDGSEAVSLYEQHQPDVCIIDISMPVMNGLEATRQILRTSPGAKIIIMTMHLNEEYLNQVLSAGAMGYLLKNTNKTDLINSIRRVYNGEKVFSTSVSDLMTQSYIRQSKKQSGGTRSDNRIQLTRRENEILKLIAEGQTSQAIAAKLFISPRTVDTHRANLMQKLNVKNSAALVRYAVENGYT